MSSNADATTGRDAGRETGGAPKTSTPTRIVVPLIAVGVCIGGVALMVRSLREVTRSADRPKLAHELVPPAAAPSTPMPANRPPSAAAERKLPVPPPDATFEPITTTDDAKRIAAAAASRFGELAAKVEGLSNTPIQTGDQIGASLDAFLAPLLTDASADHAGYLSRNGARPEESKAVARMLGGIGGLLHLCALDLSKAVVRRTPPLNPAIAAQLKQFTPGAAAFSMSENSGPEGKVCSLTIPLATILPGANANVADDATQIELLVPAKLKEPSLADKPLQLGFTMWKGPGKAWVPQFLSFHTNDMETVRAIRDAIAPRATGARPAPANPSGG